MSTKQAAIDAVVALAAEAIAEYDALEDKRKKLREDAVAAKQALRAFDPDHPLLADSPKPGRPKAKEKSKQPTFNPSEKLQETVLDAIKGFDGREFTAREVHEQIDSYSSSAVDMTIRYLRGRDVVVLSGSRGQAKTYQMIGDN